MTEDEMVGWHHQFNGHEFVQTPGDGEGQGSLGCQSSWGRKESDMTEQLNQTELCLYSQKTTLQNFSVEFYFELKRQHKYVTIQSPFATYHQLYFRNV